MHYRNECQAINRSLYNYEFICPGKMKVYEYFYTDPTNYAITLLQLDTGTDSQKPSRNLWLVLKSLSS